MPAEIPTPASDPAENSGTRQVFLPSEGFKGILRVSDGRQTLVRQRDQGWTGGTMASGAKLQVLCVERVLTCIINGLRV
jgi:hypothetical protein